MTEDSSRSHYQSSYKAGKPNFDAIHTPEAGVLALMHTLGREQAKVLRSMGADKGVPSDFGRVATPDNVISLTFPDSDVAQGEGGTTDTAAPLA